MPTPIAPRIIVAHNAQLELHTFARAHSTPPSLALRARMVLRAAAVEQPTHRQIGHELGCATLTVGPWRRRSLELGVPGLQDARRSGRPRILAPPTRVQVIAVARAWPQDQERPVTRWTRNEIVATRLEALNTAAISRSRVWRILQDVARKPHQSAYGLKSPDEDCEAQAHHRCHLDAKALESSQQGRLVICGDEKTGRPVLERKAPTKPAQPGRRERREPEDSRHGTRVLIHAWAVATGQRAWTMGATRKATDCVAHLTEASHRFPGMQRDDGVLDNLHTPWSLAVCRVVARWCKGPFEPHRRTTGPPRRALLNDPSHRHGLHLTPQPGAWLNQAELFLSVLPRRFLARGSFSSAKDFVRPLERFLQDDNARHAHPYRWTYPGEP